MPKSIAKLVIEGVIEKENDTYKQKWILETLEALSEKKDVGALVVHINSPGGSVYESDEVYEALLKYKKETDNPVYAYFASLAASGGYYIGCAADKIIANRNSLTGSIGVIAGQFIDLTGLMKTHGIKSEIIHAGRNKAMGSFSEPITDEQRAIMQSIADECYEQFTGIVAQRRNLPIEKVREIADGRIYTAKQAKELGLVDDILNFEDTVDMMKKLFPEKQEKQLTVREYKMKPKRNLIKMLKETSSNFSGKKTSENLIAEKLGKRNIPFPAYYCDWPGGF